MPIYQVEWALDPERAPELYRGAQAQRALAKQMVERLGGRLYGYYTVSARSSACATISLPEGIADPGAALFQASHGAAADIVVSRLHHLEETA